MTGRIAAMLDVFRGEMSRKRDVEAAAELAAAMPGDDLPACGVCGRAPFAAWGRRSGRFLAVHRAGCSRPPATGETRAECLAAWRAQNGGGISKG